MTALVIVLIVLVWLPLVVLVIGVGLVKREIDRAQKGLSDD